MIRSGDTLYNPVTGEVIRFVETAADTGGDTSSSRSSSSRTAPSQRRTSIRTRPRPSRSSRARSPSRRGRRRSSRRPARRSAWIPERRTSSGTPARRTLGSEPRSVRRCSSSRSSRRCSVSQTTARRTARACRTRCGSGYRECPLRRRAAPVSAGVDAEGGPRAGLPARPAPGLQADLRVVRSPDAALAVQRAHATTRRASIRRAP